MSEGSASSSSDTPAAYYAAPSLLRRKTPRDWWTVLHPPYTLLHVSLVVIGACLTGPVSGGRFIATLAAFFLAVGVGAHCLDELHGRPLHTSLPTWQLILASALGLGGAVALGVVGLFVVRGWFFAFILVGLIAALGYNLELFNGRLHTRAVVVLSWGAFPILTAFYAQHRTLSLSAIFAAGFGAMLTLLQQQLSTPARYLRRRVVAVHGTLDLSDGSSVPLNKEVLLVPLESSLRTLCRAVPLLAVGLVLARFVHV
ncbi:MAG: hypothetical protein HKL85_08380 [Acidimicrobiaceae bacterium]|nr:hypothetical protein [Acidimicrobiaceae bacterium]